ncbi:hypothetical protein [Kitasatospora sp. NPDC086791]|uniref:hypothetical protein n=1 Tax=Kitasatospora sp. NPDC086791 TaxID=3155178 RepID=UPI00341B951F
MSATIRIAAPTVTEVLLVDGWHEVRHESFRVGSYKLVTGGNGPYEQLIEDMEDRIAGFMFEDTRGRTLAGPITSILATRS